jgi:hypothetical protein
VVFRRTPDRPVACYRSSLVHILQSMAPKDAALLAFVGTLLIAALLVWNLIFDVLSVLRGLLPAMRLLSSIIYAFGAVTVALFFFVFQKRSN